MDGTLERNGILGHIDVQQMQVRKPREKKKERTNKIKCKHFLYILSFQTNTVIRGIEGNALPFITVPRTGDTEFIDHVRHNFSVCFFLASVKVNFDILIFQQAVIVVTKLYSGSYSKWSRSRFNTEIRRTPC